MKQMLMVLLAACIVLSCTGCGGHIGGEPADSDFVLDGYPYEPDKPVPPPHDGVFASEYGTMTFNGDGESVALDFNQELSELTGVPTGEQTATYVFMSGPVAPGGSIPFRYDNAWTVIFEIGDQSYEIELGLVDEAGNATVGVDKVTEERIPFLLQTDDGYINPIFMKQA